MRIRRKVVRIMKRGWEKVWEVGQAGVGSEDMGGEGGGVGGRESWRGC